MRIPRPRLRLRVRTLMVAVGVLALALGGWTSWERREYCLRQAEQCEQTAEVYRMIAEGQEESVAALRRRDEERRRAPKLDFQFAVARGRSGMRVTTCQVRRLVEPTHQIETAAAKSREIVARCLRLAARYRHAASHPWQAIPDASERATSVSAVPEDARVAPAPNERHNG